MKIITFGSPQRIGTVVDEGRTIVDLNLAYTTYLAEKKNDSKPYATAEGDLPSELSKFLTASGSSIKNANNVLEDFVLPQLQKGSLSDLKGPSGEKVAFKASEISQDTPPLPSLASRVFCIWINFPSHNQASLKNAEGKDITIQELTKEMKAKQIYGFYKLPQTIVGHDANVNVPRWVRFLDYETELAAYIGKRGGGIIDGKMSPVSVEEAKEMIAGYSCFNDWSLRDENLVIGGEPLDRNPLNFALRKNIPGGSLGPHLVIDETIDPYKSRITTKVNGEIRQDANVDEMVNKFEELIAYISRFLTLYPGDIITSGTPSGTAVDSTRQNPTGKKQGEAKVDDESLFLKQGDVVEGTISQIGTLRNKINFV